MGQGKSTRNFRRTSLHAIERDGGGDPSYHKASTKYYNAKGVAGKKARDVELIKVDTVGESVENFFRKYELSTTILGTGSYAEVRLATNLTTEEEVAVKIMRKSQMEEGDLEDVRREAAILRNLDHQNIVKVYEHYEDNNFVFLTMEFLSGGELFQGIGELTDFTEKDTRDIIITLIHALLYCKNRGVAHRDLKPENILLRKRIFNKKGENTEVNESGMSSAKKLLEKSIKEARTKYEIALADFGFATQVRNQDAYTSMETQCGSPIFMAPEVLQDKRYNYKCDVWSLGVICFMILSGGDTPFRAETMDELQAKIRKGKWNFHGRKAAWKKVSDNAKNFLKKVLVIDPKKRATYEEMLDHPWFKASSSTADMQAPINFSAMQKFNYKRKMMKAVKARQAANVFKLLMTDMEREESDDRNLQEYLKIVRLTDFYHNPDSTTEAEAAFARKQNMKTIQLPDLTENPRITSAYFADLDDYV